MSVTRNTSSRKLNLTLSETALQEAAAGKLHADACEKVFLRYDRDRDGAVDVGELRAMCMEMGVLLSEAELRAAVHVLDADGDGKIGYDEFQRWWATTDRFERLRRNEAELAFLNGAFASFLSFDRDMDGTLSRDEFAALHDVLRASGYRTHDVDADWRAMDTDASGRISFSEYVDWLILSARSQEQQQKQGQEQKPAESS